MQCRVKTRMGKLVGIVASAIVVLLTMGPVPEAGAWELQMAGSFTWTYEWYTQRGHKGFLGPYNTDSGATTRAANLNFWNGGRFDTDITTGAQAGWSYFNAEFWPTVKINQALSLTGTFRLGAYGDPRASNYHTQDAPGIRNAFSEGQWTMLWASAQTPLGTIGVGKRPWGFGTGLQYDGADARTTESLSLIVPYGPFDIGIAFYPYRFAGRSSIPSYFLEDPYNLPLYPTTNPAIRQLGEYFSHADASGNFSSDVRLFLTYALGPVKAGILGTYGSFHIGPEALLVDPANPPVNPLVPQDTELFHGTAYLKFCTSNIFYNAELAWLYWTDRYHADPANAIGPPNPRYIEQWRYMSESGFFISSLKVSFLTVWTPGPERRGGALLDKQPAAFVRHPNYDRQLGNASVFRPYAYIFGYDYGSGLEAYSLSGNGYVRDAAVMAARLDYAVAANLNLYGSVLYAQRGSHGYSWGCLGPNAGRGNFATPPDGNLNLSINRYPSSPNIPDTALGYEVDLGFDWALLEGWNLGCTVGYWKPGKWFSYACVDRSVPGWETGTAANNYGTRPNRDIDPILGGQVTFTLTY